MTKITYTAPDLTELTNMHNVFDTTHTSFMSTVAMPDAIAAMEKSFADYFANRNGLDSDNNSLLKTLVAAQTADDGLNAKQTKAIAALQQESVGLKGALMGLVSAISDSLNHSDTTA